MEQFRSLTDCFLAKSPWILFSCGVLAFGNLQVPGRENFLRIPHVFLFLLGLFLSLWRFPPLLRACVKHTGRWVVIHFICDLLLIVFSLLELRLLLSNNTEEASATQGWNGNVATAVLAGVLTFAIGISCGIPMGVHLLREAEKERCGFLRGEVHKRGDSRGRLLLLSLGFLLAWVLLAVVAFCSQSSGFWGSVEGSNRGGLASNLGLLSLPAFALAVAVDLVVLSSVFFVCVSVRVVQWFYSFGPAPGSSSIVRAPKLQDEERVKEGKNAEGQDCASEKLRERSASGLPSAMADSPSSVGPEGEWITESREGRQINGRSGTGREEEEGGSGICTEPVKHREEQKCNQLSLLEGVLGTFLLLSPQKTLAECPAPLALSERLKAGTATALSGSSLPNAESEAEAKAEQRRHIPPFFRLLAKMSAADLSLKIISVVFLQVSLVNYTFFPPDPFPLHPPSDQHPQIDSTPSEETPSFNPTQTNQTDARPLSFEENPPPHHHHLIQMLLSIFLRNALPALLPAIQLFAVALMLPTTPPPSSRFVGSPVAVPISPPQCADQGGRSARGVLRKGPRQQSHSGAATSRNVGVTQEKRVRPAERHGGEKRAYRYGNRQAPFLFVGQAIRSALGWEVLQALCWFVVAWVFGGVGDTPLGKGKDGDDNLGMSSSGDLSRHNERSRVVGLFPLLTMATVGILCVCGVAAGAATRVMSLLGTSESTVSSLIREGAGEEEEEAQEGKDEIELSGSSHPGRDSHSNWITEKYLSVQREEGEERILPPCLILITASGILTASLIPFVLLTLHSRLEHPSSSFSNGTAAENRSILSFSGNNQNSFTAFSPRLVLSHLFCLFLLLSVLLSVLSLCALLFLRLCHSKISLLESAIDANEKIDEKSKLKTEEGRGSSDQGIIQGGIGQVTLHMGVCAEERETKTEMGVVQIQDQGKCMEEGLIGVAQSEEEGGEGGERKTVSERNETSKKVELVDEFPNSLPKKEGILHSNPHSLTENGGHFFSPEKETEIIKSPNNLSSSQNERLPSSVPHLLSQGTNDSRLPSHDPDRNTKRGPPRHLRDAVAATRRRHSARAGGAFPFPSLASPPPPAQPPSDLPTSPTWLGGPLDQTDAHSLSQKVKEKAKKPSVEEDQPKTVSQTKSSSLLDKQTPEKVYHVSLRSGLTPPNSIPSLSLRSRVLIPTRELSSLPKRCSSEANLSQWQTHRQAERDFRWPSDLPPLPDYTGHSSSSHKEKEKGRKREDSKEECSHMDQRQKTQILVAGSFGKSVPDNQSGGDRTFTEGSVGLLPTQKHPPQPLEKSRLRDSRKDAEGDHLSSVPPPSHGETLFAPKQRPPGSPPFSSKSPSEKSDKVQEGGRQPVSSGAQSSRSMDSNGLETVRHWIAPSDCVRELVPDQPSVCKLPLRHEIIEQNDRHLGPPRIHPVRMDQVQAVRHEDNRLLTHSSLASTFRSSDHWGSPQARESPSSFMGAGGLVRELEENPGGRVVSFAPLPPPCLEYEEEDEQPALSSYRSRSTSSHPSQKFRGNACLDGDGEGEGEGEGEEEVIEEGSVSRGNCGTIFRRRSSWREHFPISERTANSGPPPAPLCYADMLSLFPSRCPSVGGATEPEMQTEQQASGVPFSPAPLPIQSPGENDSATRAAVPPRPLLYPFSFSGPIRRSRLSPFPSPESERMSQTSDKVSVVSLQSRSSAEGRRWENGIPREGNCEDEGEDEEEERKADLPRTAAERAHNGGRLIHIGAHGRPPSFSLPLSPSSAVPSNPPPSYSDHSTLGKGTADPKADKVFLSLDALLVAGSDPHVPFPYASPSSDTLALRCNFTPEQERERKEGRLGTDGRGRPEETEGKGIFRRCCPPHFEVDANILQTVVQKLSVAKRESYKEAQMGRCHTEEDEEKRRSLETDDKTSMVTVSLSALSVENYAPSQKGKKDSAGVAVETTLDEVRPTGPEVARALLSASQAAASFDGRPLLFRCPPPNAAASSERRNVTTDSATWLSPSQTDSEKSSSCESRLSCRDLESQNEAREEDKADTGSQKNGLFGGAFSYAWLGGCCTGCCGQSASVVDSGGVEESCLTAEGERGRTPPDTDPLPSALRHWAEELERRVKSGEDAPWESDSRPLSTRPALSHRAVIEEKKERSDSAKKQGENKDRKSKKRRNSRNQRMRRRADPLSFVSIPILGKGLQALEVPLATPGDSALTTGQRDREARIPLSFQWRPSEAVGPNDLNPDLQMACSLPSSPALREGPDLTDHADADDPPGVTKSSGVSFEEGEKEGREGERGGPLCASLRTAPTQAIDNPFFGMKTPFLLSHEAEISPQRSPSRELDVQKTFSVHHERAMQDDLPPLSNSPNRRDMQLLTHRSAESIPWPADEVSKAAKDESENEGSRVHVDGSAIAECPSPPSPSNAVPLSCRSRESLPLTARLPRTAFRCSSSAGTRLQPFFETVPLSLRASEKFRTQTGGERCVAGVVGHSHLELGLLPHRGGETAGASLPSRSCLGDVCLCGRVEWDMV
uniref:Transmembrane protein n=1 Tax=Chromera velia CCMP2878 TaxID=1169474 RepID=A0A0G4FIX3_9ALVE|eukprot:Cvel_17283.t1-p1 / transcript=Cvel_17283.t1 / gene=Cvel_17283 / organism=Chromera_velia_CCMP2878 / gene_product=hypothetical protein / transcript_product=hypothetical protein / location=Cvel_scaffold1371:8717-16707(-) / protein_length=2506 / sequence_SO=supercontig / SO=protein_coding / is_pseudo=false